MQTNTTSSTSNPKPITALRKRTVLERTGLSNTHLYRLIQQGHFPRPRKLSERVSVWSEAEINDWLAARFAA